MKAKLNIPSPEGSVDVIVRPDNISCMFKELQDAHSKKIDDANLNTSTLINGLQLQMEENYLALTNSIDAKIGSMQSEICSIAVQFNTLSEFVDNKLKEHEKEIFFKLDQVERREKLLDVIVKNIPKVPSENLSFSYIFTKALALKKIGYLKSVATRSGLVFVKFVKSEVMVNDT